MTQIPHKELMSTLHGNTRYFCVALPSSSTSFAFQPSFRSSVMTLPPYSFASVLLLTTVMITILLLLGNQTPCGFTQTALLSAISASQEPELEV